MNWAPSAPDQKAELADLDAQGRRLDRQAARSRTSWHACSTASLSAAIRMP
jgi:hypothetical protein